MKVTGKEGHFKVDVHIRFIKLWHVNDVIEWSLKLKILKWVLHWKAMAWRPGFGFLNCRLGQSHPQAIILARLGPAYLGLAWLGSRPEARPIQHYSCWSLQLAMLRKHYSKLLTTCSNAIKIVVAPQVLCSVGRSAVGQIFRCSKKF
jgi:hypothetical protein